MSIQDDLRANSEIPAAFVGALGGTAGDGLRVADPVNAISDAITDEQKRITLLTFTAASGDVGTIAFIAAPTLVTALEQTASDELLVTATGNALDAAATALSGIIATDIETDHPRESDDTALAKLLGAGPSVVYPIAADNVVVACLAVLVKAGTAEVAPVSTAGDSSAGVLGDLGKAALVLGDVEMGVTAELGRCEMTMRELLGLTPGAVIDLDRAAGAPVDVLVNGTLIARGEVVVIDEEFGIRISEIVKNTTAA